MSNVVKAPMTNKRDWKFHRDRIANAWGKQVHSIIETGQALVDAKAELEHGSFEAMVQSKLPFTKSTAHRLRVIAENEILSKMAHVPLLPPSWGTLYELTKLPDEVLIAALKDGSIHPKMERKDAKALRLEAKPPKPSKSKAKPKSDFIVAVDMLAAAITGMKLEQRLEIVADILERTHVHVSDLREVCDRRAKERGDMVSLKIK